MAMGSTAVDNAALIQWRSRNVTDQIREPEVVISRRTLIVGGGIVAVAGGGAIYAGLRDMGSLADYESAVAQTRSSLAQRPEASDLIRYATLAANSHNSQPWRFKVTSSSINILPDMARRLSAVDPDDHHLFASLGCAAENLAIAAAMRGQRGAPSFSPAHGGVVSFDGRSVGRAEPALLAAIPKRQSTRGDYSGKSVSAPDLAALAAVAAVPGIDMVLITDRQRINQIRDLVVAGNSAQLADAAFMRELKAWLRFNPRQAMTSGDGLFTATSGNPALPSWLGPKMFDIMFKADAENEKYARQIASSAGIAVFVAQAEGHEHWVQAGRACQRFALAATSLGLKHAFLNQPVEVAQLRPELAALVGIPGRRPDIVMRFGYGPALPFSARRPVNAVLA
jgi:nitroreductase